MLKDWFESVDIASSGIAAEIDSDDASINAALSVGYFSTSSKTMRSLPIHLLCLLWRRPELQVYALRRVSIQELG